MIEGLEDIARLEREAAVVGRGRAVWVSQAGLENFGRRGRVRPRPDDARERITRPARSA